MIRLNSSSPFAKGGNKEGMQIIIRRNKRNKRIRISVGEDGKVLVTYPWWSNRKQAEKFTQQKRNWIEKNVAKMKARKSDSLLKKGTRQDYLDNKEKARRLIENKINRFNQYYNFRINRISIRNQKTRWGSCSKKGNLNFNWRIVWLEDELANYLVVHEMCHLKEMNHSNFFWELTARAIPDYKIISKKLRLI